ncbi:RHS repeat-associated core domain-containing protein, partial [Citrobacter farmeri]|nr:AHH domain-containing protein [Citrobacter farmeri]
SKATYGRHTDQREQRRTTFVWEGFRLLQETTWQGKRTYLYDAEQPYTPVASVTGCGESRKIGYYHTDVTGTVQEVTAADGTLVWAGYQTGFGENRGDISNSGAYFEQPLRLPGQYYDEETGLHYNLFRYYAPECGRFISQDPISIRGGLNLYAYGPNPLTWIDPLGLDLHHIIPQEIWKEFKSDLKKVSGYVQNVTKKAADMTNLIALDKPFHGNHPAYSQYVREAVEDLKAKGNLTLQGLRDLQDELRGKINDAKGSGKNLNDHFKSEC